MRLSPPLIFTALASVVTAGAVIGGLMAIGSPEAQRARRLDAQRLTDLQAIASAVETFRSLRGRLPENLIVLQQQQPTLRIADPVSTEPYGYTMNDTASYELCARFDTILSESRNGGDAASFWNHGQGKHCFALSVRR
jgi:hypothetical protein